MLANQFAQLVIAYCAHNFPKDSLGMEKHQANSLAGSRLIDCTCGTHKYVPKEKLNADLGLKDGEGVYGYARFQDGSYCLMTCMNGIAVWSGNVEDKAEWPYRNPV